MYRRFCARFLILTLLASITYISPIAPFSVPIAKAAAVADCTLSIAPSTEQLLGENFGFSVQIDNPGADPGFSPMVEIVLPPEITHNTASFSIGDLPVTPVGPTPTLVTDNDGGDPNTGEITNPITGDTTVLDIGLTYFVFRLPLGSYVPDQDPVSLNVNVALSNAVTQGVALDDDIQARCGFSLGSDPLDNPGTDPVVLSGFQTSTVTPTVFSVNKSLTTQVGESETPTGENFPVNYNISTDIANTANVTNITLTENLPDTLQFVSVDAIDDDGNGFTITFTPTIGAPQVSGVVPFAPIGPFPPGGTLEVELNSVTGTTAGSDGGFDFTVFVPELDGSSDPVLDPSTGASRTISNTASGEGTFNAALVTDDSDQVDLFAKSIAVQKSVAIDSNAGPAGFSPGDVVEYTINFEVSDFFSFDDVVLEDILPDGLVYNNASSDLSITEDAATTGSISFIEATILNEENVVRGPPPFDFSGAECSNCELAITPDTTDDNDGGPPDDGDTVLAFDVSSAINGEVGLDDELIGGQIGGTPIGQPTQGTLTFQATIQESFIDGQAFDNSIDAFDSMLNTVTVSGNISSTPDPNTFVTDGSSANIAIVEPEFTKTIPAFTDTVGGVDAAPFSVATPISISPGDRVTFALSVDIPTGDLEDLRITDFLPIPFFDVNEISTTFDAATLATQYTPTDGVPGSIPAPGVIGYGDNTTGFPGPLPTPVITKDVASNSFDIDFTDQVTFDETPSDGIFLELLVTVTATSDPFASGLGLVNVTSFFADDSNVTNVDNAADSADIITAMPELNIFKGAVATDQLNAVFDPVTVGPTTFAAPGSSPSFTAPFSSSDLTTNSVESDISDVDAGDTITFAIIIENEGSAEAFDVLVTDTLPAGFVSPANPAALNLQVFNANGDDLVANTEGGLFGQIVLGGTTDGSDTSISIFDAAGNLPPLDTDAGGTALTGEGLANEGANIIVITYDLVVDQSVDALEVLTNLAELSEYTAVDEGTNFVSEAALFQESVDTTIASISFTKTAIEHPSDGQVHTTMPDATIGEVVRYKLEITVPEGTITNASLIDNIPNGLGYFIDNDVTITGASPTCTATSFNGSLPTITVNSPVGAGFAASGANIDIDFDNNIVATDDNDADNNTFCLLYDVGVLDVVSNDGTPSGTTVLLNSATFNFAAGESEGPESDDINVVEPNLRVIKNVNSSTGDAGDVLVYTIEVDHRGSSSTDGFDLEVTDVISSKFAVNQNFDSDGLDNDGDGLIDGADANEVAGDFFVGGVTGGTFTWNNATTDHADFLQLPDDGSDIVFQFEVTVQNDVAPSEVIANTADLTYNSIPNNPVGPLFERSGDDDDTQNFVIVTIDTDKDTQTTSEAHTGTGEHTGLTDVAIGEDVTYRITLEVPESELTNLVITDTLPDFLHATSAVLVQDDTGAAAPVISINDNNIDLINEEVVVTFASITNAPNPGSEFIIIDIVATVVDNVGNSDGQVKTNNVSVDFNELVGAPLTSSVAVEIVEPNLDIDKVVSSATADAGDILTYTVTIDHNASSTADAFDISATDTLPADLTVVGNFDSDGLDNDGDGLIDGADGDELAGGLAPFFDGTDTFTWNLANTNNALFEQLTTAQTISFQFQAQVDNSVFPGQEITNTVDVNWDSLPADGDPDERSDSDDDGAGVVVNIDALTITKQHFSNSFPETGTAQFNGGLQDLGIGEEVRYRISVPIPETVFTNFSITDEVPDFFEVRSGSLISDDGVTHTLGAPVIQDNNNADGIDDTIIFNFGDVTNAPDADTEQVIVEVVVVVVDNIGNAAGTGYTNTAVVNYDEDPNPGTITDTETVDVVVPSLQFTKTVAPLTADAGDEVVYTITVNNTGSGPAYDINITDQVPVSLTVDTNFDADGLDNNGDGGDGDVNEVVGTFFGGSTFTWNNATTGLAQYNSLAAGASFTIQYRATLNVASSPGDAITNDAELDYDTAPGANPDERDISESDDATVNVPFDSSAVKTLRDADTTKAIGEIVPYRIVLTVQEGTISPLTVTDVLPAGLAYVPGSATVIESNDPDIAISGTPTNPIEAPASIAIGTATAQTLTFNFGAVVNSNTNNGIDETITLEYDAVVLNTADNNNTNTKVNSANVDFDGNNVGPITAPSITVVEPDLEVTKTTTYVSGDTVTYQIQVENNGTDVTATAHDVVLTDVLPAGVTFVGNETLINGPALPTTNAVDSPTIVFSFDEVTTAFNNANPIIFTFDVTIDAGTGEGSVLNNVIDVEYSSIDNVIADVVSGNDLTNERTGDDADAGGVVNDYNDASNVNITVTRPNLTTSQKTVNDVNGGEVQVGDILEYTLEIINTGNLAATGIRVTDDIPNNVENFTIVTPPGSGVDASQPAPAGANGNGFLDFTGIALDAAGGLNDSTTIVYTVEVTVGTPLGTDIENFMTVFPPNEGGSGTTDSTLVTTVGSDLVVTKFFLPGNKDFNGGEGFNYGVYIENNGNGDSTNTTFIDVIPANITYVPDSIFVDNQKKTDEDDGDIADFGITNAGAVNILIPVIPPGEKVEVFFRVEANEVTETTQVTNEVNVTDDQAEDETATVDITILPPTPVVVIEEPRRNGAGGGGGPGGRSTFVSGLGLKRLSTPNNCEDGDGADCNNIEKIFGEEEGNEREEDMCEELYDDYSNIGGECLSFDENRELNFYDLDPDDPATPFILTLKNTKIIDEGDYVFSGHGNHSTGKQQQKFQGGLWEFQPERAMTRLEVVKVALVSNCIPVENEIPVPANGFQFSDLPADVDPSDEAMHFAARVFYTGYKHGVVEGFGDASARPLEIATNAEMIALALRAARVIPEGFDLSYGPWYKKYMEFARLNGIFNDMVSLHSAPVLRKNFSQIMVRVMAYNPNPQIHGYIEKVDIQQQKYYENVIADAPSPDFGMFDVIPDVCELPDFDRCHVHDIDRELKFYDVDKNAWYYAFSEAMRTTKIVETGDFIVSGHGNHSTGRQQAKFQAGAWQYQPDRNTSRLEIVKTALVSNCITVEDRPPVPEDGFRFADIDVNEDSLNEAEFFIARVFYTAYKHGVITSENARPLDAVTRIEAIAILNRASKAINNRYVAPEMNFKDVSNQAWFYRDLGFAHEMGIIGGYGDGYARIDRKLQRSELAKLTMFYMLINNDYGIRRYTEEVGKHYGFLSDDTFVH